MIRITLCIIITSSFSTVMASPGAIGASGSENGDLAQRGRSLCCCVGGSLRVFDTFKLVAVSVLLYE